VAITSEEEKRNCCVDGSLIAYLILKYVVYLIPTGPSKSYKLITYYMP
jgi:hypothetical protein